MTQFLLGLQALLIFAQAGIVTLNMDEQYKVIAVFACGAVLAFIGPFLPKVSEALRRVMSLQRRG